MNDILQLRGQFIQKKNENRPGPRNIKLKSEVTSNKLALLKNELMEVQNYWKGITCIQKVLFSVCYDRVIAKSNRIKDLFGTHSSDLIVGARYAEDLPTRHVITYCMERGNLDYAISRIDKSIQILKDQFNGCITYSDIEEVNAKEKSINGMARSCFISCVVDCFYVERFQLDLNPKQINDSALITIYDTKMDTVKLFENLGISILNDRIINKTTLLLTPREYTVLKSQAPFLIAMAVSDLSALTKNDFDFVSNSSRFIEDPTTEPTIGVIDTLFDESVYFSKWVTYSNKVSPDIPIKSEDKEHGTMVSSIIVDGPALNPNLEDGCGHFKVRHFGVVAGGFVNSFALIRTIEDIVLSNTDIKVWNLSLGSKLEVNANFISPEAAILDKLQYEYDVIFIIAGTNKNSDDAKKIGSPADSINSLVVNAVNFDGVPATYSRQGPVLSFYGKPDVCYYGGDVTQRMIAYAPKGEYSVMGTSFAAPWIARKLAYLIYIMGLNREVAKALIVDTAAGWNTRDESCLTMGYGIVPKHIKDIIQSSDDEIRFILSDDSQEFDTYNYNIPVPIYKEASPFVARATLCYFPKCSRNQGIDYTDTELDIHFGRMCDVGIKSINNNKQSNLGIENLTEEHVREYFRKWDNVKHICERVTNRNKPKKVYGTNLWGISLKTKERLDQKTGDLKFGVIITLKEINGVNRIQDFIQQCSMRGWLVNKISVNNRIQLYNKAEEHIIFE